MIISLLTFMIGSFIIFYRYNFLAYVVGLEIMLLAANMNFLFAICSSSGIVTLINFILLIIAAIETVIGLALIVNMHKLSGTIEVSLTQIKG